MLKFDYDIKKRKAIVIGNSDEFNALRDNFSIANPVAHILRKRNKFIPSRNYAITPTGQFDIGLFYEIEKYLITNQIVNIEITDNFKSQYTVGYELNQLEFPLKLELRDYQKTIITECIKNGRGIAVLGTGGGKTLVIATLIENFKKLKHKLKCLVIVPDIGLVEQTYKEFLEYAPTFSVSKWSGNNELNIASDVIIANSKILLSRFDENEWVKYVDLLIVDECHKINHGSEIGKIVNKIATSNKFGFTGTLPPNKLDYWSVLGKFGAVIFEKTSHELREENYLTDVEVKICHIEYKTKLKKVKTLNTTENYMNELEFIKNNSFRQDILRQICIKFNKNILIMVNHIEHGEKLQAYLTENIQGRDVFFIQGSVDIEDRENVKHTMENKDNIICIAMSSIFSTGVNIKNIHMIIFAAGGKALIRTVQSIGRGLRLHPTKTKLVIIDIADNLYYGMQHAEDRKEIYSKEKIKYKTYLFNEK